MPPIPPMPPMSGAPPAGLGSGYSTIMASVVIIKDATPDASTSAVLTTLVGSMIPTAFMSTYSPLLASNPLLRSPPSMSLSTTMDPSKPAF